MYDFWFGTDDDIRANEADYLLFVKRMMPRWTNSIPDSEYLALHQTLQLLDLQGRRPVLIETGVGASTIVLLNFAMKHGGVLYSWDPAGPKGAFLRAVMTDTLTAHYRQPVQAHWKYIPYSSHSPQIGIPVLHELGETVDFCFFDSEHTREVLIGEVERAVPLLRDGAIVAIDDANYNYIHTNIAYINMQRRKLGLPPSPDPPGNAGEPFYREVEQSLRQAFAQVDYLDDTYKRDYQKDLFWSYFSADRSAMGRLSMEKTDALEHRYDSWRVSGRR
jgi:predicted O-methyltransferase YrrM